MALQISLLTLWLWLGPSSGRLVRPPNGAQSTPRNASPPTRRNGSSSKCTSPQTIELMKDLRDTTNKLCEAKKTIEESLRAMEAKWAAWAAMDERTDARSKYWNQCLVVEATKQCQEAVNQAEKSIENFRRELRCSLRSSLRAKSFDREMQESEDNSLYHR